MHTVRTIKKTKELIKAYLSGFSKKLQILLKIEIHNVKDTKLLTKWQIILQTVLAKYGIKTQSKPAAKQTKPLAKLIREIFQEMPLKEQKRTIEEMGVKGILSRRQLAMIVRTLCINIMYISRNKSLKIPLELVTCQGQ